MSKIIEKMLLFFVAFLVLAILIGFPLKWLWNWLMPELFGLPLIDFWQAIGLSLLCSFLFKSSMYSYK